MNGKTRNQLNVWMNAVLVGTWKRYASNESFSYAEEWLQHPKTRPLSLSLPFTVDNQIYQGERVKNFFDNLLPDNDNIRRRLAQQYRTGSTEVFDLLVKLGRDCVGAIQLLSPDENPKDLFYFSIQGVALSTSEIARRLRLTKTGNNPDLRLSIAGAQEKTALLWHQGHWCLPQGSTPTTHIFKLPLGEIAMNGTPIDMQFSVENEWLCSKIVAAYGLEIASCEIAQFEEQKVLIVQRFDRKLASDQDWIMRLPQEDFCQALGTSPLHKYEKDGGCGIEQGIKLLMGSENSEDRYTFFKTQLIFWLLAATDGHAKNFSLMLKPEGRYCLTPLYDVLSCYPIVGKGKNRVAYQKLKLAMGVKGKSRKYYELEDIQPRHWIYQAQQVGLDPRKIQEIINELSTMTPKVITQVQAQLPDDFPPELAESVFQGIDDYAKILHS